MFGLDSRVLQRRIYRVLNCSISIWVEFSNFGWMAFCSTGAWTLLEQHQEGREGDKGDGQEDQRPVRYVHIDVL